MSQKELSTWLKALDIGLIVATLAIGVAFPSSIESVLSQTTGGEAFRLPFITVGIISLVPILLAELIAWRVFSRIGENNSFSTDNSQRLRTISFLGAFEALLTFMTAITLHAVDFPISSTVNWLIFMALISVVFSVAAAALSHLVYKKALQRMEELDRQAISEA